MPEARNAGENGQKLARVRYEAEAHDTEEMDRGTDTQSQPRCTFVGSAR